METDERIRRATTAVAIGSISVLIPEIPTQASGVPSPCTSFTTKMTNMEPTFDMKHGDNQPRQPTRHLRRRAPHEHTFQNTQVYPLHNVAADSSSIQQHPHCLEAAFYYSPEPQMDWTLSSSTEVLAPLDVVDTTLTISSPAVGESASAATNVPKTWPLSAITTERLIAHAGLKEVLAPMTCEHSLVSPSTPRRGRHPLGIIISRTLVHSTIAAPCLCALARPCTRLESLQWLKCCS
ncbi:hypothetical protein Ae201684P_009183 [Aphanomyces euteiches]|uniref:Uncharacterized protein n=1 Tax=Aphanomyces euteiches TaxID=100861 RepID=A0A6G0WHK0_9STRA|nr:hypothetical protein Ae201684_015075 [Aphanomyces euteiches]KAH9062917.1 hypothetical protein Ae201684P_009183 [Aphanomyces euteiches]